MKIKLCITILSLFALSCTNSKKHIRNYKYNYILSRTINNYCRNYNYSDGDIIIIKRYSIAEELTQMYYLRNKPVNAIIKSFLNNKGIINDILPFKIKNNKIIIFNKNKNIMISKNQFLKKLWLVILKKKLEKKYKFSGQIIVYYRVYKFFIDDNYKKLYEIKHNDSQILNDHKIKFKIKIFLAFNKKLKSYKNKKLKEYLKEVIQELNIYPQKDEIKIIRNYQNNTIKIIIENKNTKESILIFLDDKLKKLINMKYIKPKLYDLTPLAYPYNYNGKFDCKSKE